MMVEFVTAAAKIGFLKYGYHGFSLEDCVECAEIQIIDETKPLFKNKKMLTWRIFQELQQRSSQVISNRENPFFVQDGQYLALLPLKFRECGDPEFIKAIDEYYMSWVDAFVLDRFGRSFQGVRYFWMWIGFWQLVALDLVPSNDLSCIH